ncbi:MAG: hypothetical protein JWQ97_3985 [Phenylobacterium sp.]|nr:hypothetical protein [Phenylobacterium sp.]
MGRHRQAPWIAPVGSSFLTRPHLSRLDGGDGSLKRLATFASGAPPQATKKNMRQA